MKLLLPILTILTAFFLTASRAQAVNESTTLILHASADLAPCEAPQQGGLNCIDQLPVVDVTGMALPEIFLYVRNYESLAGVQCAFEWPPTWTCLSNSWDCQSNQLAVVQPCGEGPGAGNLATVFDPILVGAMTPIGMLIFGPTATGCLDIVESIYPFGTIVLSANLDKTPVPPSNRGRVCAGPGGYAACNPAATPVRDETWGRIKSSYQ
jgi:hypothetical protein